MKKLFQQLISLPALAIAGVIALYQKLLSPDHSWLRYRFPYGYCRHYPSCSEYSRRALLKYGLFYGAYLSAKRILKCNPWAKPSIDPIPN